MYARGKVHTAAAAASSSSSQELRLWQALHDQNPRPGSGEGKKGSGGWDTPVALLCGPTSYACASPGAWSHPVLPQARGVSVPLPTPPTPLYAATARHGKLCRYTTTVAGIGVLPQSPPHLPPPSPLTLVPICGQLRRRRREGEHHNAIWTLPWLLLMPQQYVCVEHAAAQVSAQAK